MAHPPEKREQVRRFYVNDRLSLEVAAASASVPYATAREWKRRDAQDGDDWDRARTAKRLADGGLGEMTTVVLEEFARLFSITTERLRTDGDIEPLDAATALAKLSDAYVKTVNAAGKTDSKMSRYAVALEILDELLKFARTEAPDALPQLLPLLDPFGRRVTEMYGNT